jgi:hypothetical protein
MITGSLAHWEDQIEADRVEAESNLVPCVRCDHDISWHYTPRKDWTDKEIDRTKEEWEKETTAYWKDSQCRQDGCSCAAFKHPKAPRRREAIEHTRSLK